MSHCPWGWLGGGQEIGKPPQKNGPPPHLGLGLGGAAGGGREAVVDGGGPSPLAFLCALRPQHCSPHPKNKWGGGTEGGRGDGGAKVGGWGLHRPCSTRDPSQGNVQDPLLPQMQVGGLAFLPRTHLPPPEWASSRGKWLQPLFLTLHQFGGAQFRVKGHMGVWQDCCAMPQFPPPWGAGVALGWKFIFFSPFRPQSATVPPPKPLSRVPSAGRQSWGSRVWGGVPGRVLAPP